MQAPDNDTEIRRLKRWNCAVRDLEKERDEARELARQLVRHSVDCWSYRAELAEAYPWLVEN